MTDLPQQIRPRGMRRFYKNQNVLRRQGSAALAEAAREAGVRRLISQSVAFIYAPGDGGLKGETDPIWEDAPEPFGRALRVSAAHDARVINEPSFEGIVLRYGMFYGPGTHFVSGHSQYEDIRKRRMALAGSGDSVWSFVHVDDAAQAAIDALEGGERGIYNVVDDDPAPMREWLPHFAKVIGAKPPRRFPVWLARVAVGPAMTAWATAFPGTSNLKARHELRWTPQYRSWRQGFPASLNQATAPARGAIHARG